MNIVENVRQFVETECKKPTSHYGYEPFVYHFGPVVEYATVLAEKLGADVEIVQIAGWLHDIGSIIEGRENHHLSGARIAREKLKELGYPDDRIELVVGCITNHRGSQNLERKSPEERIVAEADVLSNFDNIGGIFKAAYTFENMDQFEAQQSVRTKLQNKYHQLHFKESKQLIRPKYEAAMLLLK